MTGVQTCALPICFPVTIRLGISYPATFTNNPGIYETGSSGNFYPKWTKTTAQDFIMKAASNGYPDVNANLTGIKADLSAATASTINALREAFQLQKLYERDARGGTRYTEIVRSHFGVISPDSRLPRPEYLGGGSSPINVYPIAQTSSTDATSPQGNLAAMGTMSQRGSGFTKSFTEHCVIIGLVSVRADLNYQQGLNRMFSLVILLVLFLITLVYLLMYLAYLILLFGIGLII